MKKQSGFSLVELSIVLVILGLLTGGILAGQSLIRAAEMRSVIAQSSQYITAVGTFRDKYFALPGDMPNATSFWGRADGVAGNGQCAAPLTDTNTGAPTCNGDGNGQIALATTNEYRRVWEHLSASGLIEGSYTGITTLPTIGVNVPATKLTNVGISLYHQVDNYTDVNHWPMPYRNIFTFGTAPASATHTAHAAFLPEEAWNLDTKLDDGRPGYGRVWNFKNTSTATPGCVDSDTQATASYALTNTNKLCMIGITSGY